MRIAADKNILFAKEAFSTLGDAVMFELNDIVNENLKGFDSLLVRSTVKVDETLLKNTGIKFVGSAVAGIDHVDTEYLRKRNIGFSAANGCNARSVTEYVLTSIYSFCNPADAVVGIIGVGNIGSKVAETLQALGVRTILNDPILNERSAPLDYLARNSDIITVHVPLTKTGEHKTENLLGAEFWDKTKSSVFLIQTSRGPVCDEKALLKIKNPVIDVWADEPDINIELAKNCLYHTPHIAGHSFDGKVFGTKIIYEALCDFVSQKPSFDFKKEVFDKIEKQTLEYDKDIADILMKCRPIKEDSQNFKRLFSEKNTDERKRIFKELRQNYPKRFEFARYTITDTPPKIADELRILGFNVR